MGDDVGGGRARGPAGDEAVRVNQIYRAYLDTLYFVEFYSCLQTATLRWVRWLDFIIGLAAAIAGGSGLGILKAPQLAWLCASVTAASVILTVAKGVWNWPARIQTISDRIKSYSALSARYRRLVEDIQYKKQLAAQENDLFDKLRQDPVRQIKDEYTLTEKKRREIQNNIKRRIAYKTWWLWRDEHANDPA